MIEKLFLYPGSTLRYPFFYEPDPTLEAITPRAVVSLIEGVKMDMALSMQTSADNITFNSIFSTLLPVIYAATHSQTSWLIKQATDVALDSVARDATVDQNIRYQTSEVFTFRRHYFYAIDGTVLDITAMPQHLSLHDREVGDADVFYYTIRSTAVMHVMYVVLVTHEHSSCGSPSELSTKGSSSRSIIESMRERSCMFDIIEF
jgi:hypothetical protein